MQALPVICRTPYPAFLHLLSFLLIFAGVFRMAVGGRKAAKGVLGGHP